MRTRLNQLAFAPEVHLDVVDGQFVSHTSWPYDPVGEPKSVKPYTDQFTLEVDLMVQDPLTAAVDWITAGADMLVFHLETISLDNFKNVEAFTHVSVGVSMHGVTPVETLLEYAAYADYIQLMGIADIGAHGLPFDETVLDKIATVTQAFPQKPISIDGHVNADTITRLGPGRSRSICGRLGYYTAV